MSQQALGMIETRGLIALGSQRLTVDLNADSTGLPARYQSKSTNDGRAGDTYRAEVVGRRFSARARSVATPAWARASST